MDGFDIQEVVFGADESRFRKKVLDQITSNQITMADTTEQVNVSLTLRVNSGQS
jgi:hypothetical protein